MRAAAAVDDATGVWAVLVDALALHEDPGAAVPFVETVLECLAAFHTAGSSGQAGLDSLRAAAASIRAHSDWRDGTWRQYANPLQRGGRHSGSVDDRPLLACLVANRIATDERPALSGLRLLLILFMAGGGRQPGAATTVADAVRKAESMRAWRQVIAAMPQPGAAPADLQTWLDELSRHLATAQPPADLANVPAASIRAFFGALQALIGTVASSRPRQRPAQAVHEDEDASEPRGAIRTHAAIDGERRPGPETTLGDGRDALVAERLRPIQEVLVFGDERPDRDPEPANLTLTTSPSLAADELPLSSASARSERRLGSYRLIEISLRLRWSWDHLNAPDLRILVDAIAQDLADDGPRRAGATLCLAMLAFGRSAAQVFDLCVGEGHGASEWIDAEGCWHRPVRRPVSAWRPAPALAPSLVTVAQAVVIELPEAVRNALSALLRRSSRPGRLGDLLGLPRGDANEVLSAWLEPLRRRWPSSRLTHGRIARTLSLELFAAAGEEVVVHGITATDESVPPIAGYYLALDQAKLAGACAQAWRRMFDAASASKNGPASVHGAPVLTRDAMLAWTASLRAAVSETGALVEQHNAYCLYVLTHMLAATGHRPVNDPVESLDLLDLERGLALLADKAAHQPDEARLVPLCSLTVRLMRHWLEHLQRLARWVNAERPTLALQIESVLRPSGTRALPLFFLLGDDFETRRIDRTTLSLAMPAALAGLPANQFRRELATAAQRAAWPPELAQQILGHVDLSQSVFGPLSCQSPLSLDLLKPRLENMLGAQGWVELASPLAEGPSRRGHPRPKHAPAATLLGLAQRRAQLASNLQRSLTHIDKSLRKWIRGRDLRQVSQQDVDRLYAEVLGAREHPRTESELQAMQRIDSLLRWLKRRYGLGHLRLPASRSLVALPVDHRQGDLVQLTLWQNLRAAFEAVLHQRARRGARLARASRLAEALVGVVLYSFVCDPRAVAGLLEPSTWRLVHVPGLGIYLELRQLWPNHDEAVNRYRLHPLAALLLGRVAQSAGNFDTDLRAECQRAVAGLIGTLRRRCEGGTAPDFIRFGEAVRWLCELVARAARMRLPGHLVAYLDGSAEAVSLPAHDWLRWMTGSAPPMAADEASPLEAPPPEAAEPDRLAPVIRARTDARTDGQRRKLGRALHDDVRRAFCAVERGAGEHAEQTQRSLNRIAALLPRLADVLERHSQAPCFARAAVQWLVALLESGLGPRALRSNSAYRYYVELIGMVIDGLSALTLAEIDEDALADAYAQMLGSVSRRRVGYTWDRLREFHRFLVRHHGVPEIDWAEIAPEGMSRLMAPDAGLLCWDEYRVALRLLAEDASTDLRERRMQAFVLLLLFRFGLRVQECIALRASDLLRCGETWVVLVRRNAYRQLKSDAGVRQVPLVGPLDPLETEVLQGWLEHADETAGEDRCAVLMSRDEAPRRLVDEQRLRSRITDALRAATGSTTLHPHQLRHGFATRLVLLLATPTWPPDPLRRAILQRLIGPCDPAATRRLLLDTEDSSKRAFWALALMVGHASPATTLRWYLHAHDFQLADAFDALAPELEVRLDTVTASYACGHRLTPSRHRVAIDEAWTLKHMTHGACGTVVAAPPAAAAATLPPRPVRSEPPLAPIKVDRLLELSHRRGRIDASIPYRLMLAPEVISRLLRSEFACREAATYDLAESGWPPTPGRSAMNHLRAGSRRPAETERLRSFLNRLTDRSREPAWRASARRAVEVWIRRYRASCTPLVLASGSEVQAVASWCLASDLAAETLIVLLPDDGRSPADLHLIDPVLERRHSSLASARSTYRSQGRVRVGLQLLENSVGPLTHMTQFHRAMHVLAAWLGATDDQQGGT